MYFSPHPCSHGDCVSRVIATILIAVQAMLPPGMCFCQFVHSGPVASHHAHETSPPQPVAVRVDESCCSCPACRAPIPTVPAPHDQAPTDREPAPEPDPLPVPSAPCSGCPVVAVGPVGRVAILPATEQISLDFAVQFVASPVEVAHRLAERPAPAPPPTVQPLFVRHCALLI